MENKKILGTLPRAKPSIRAKRRTTKATKICEKQELAVVPSDTCVSEKNSNVQ